MLVDLKTGKITHQDVGQMDMYVRMYDELKKKHLKNCQNHVSVADLKRRRNHRARRLVAIRINRHQKSRVLKPCFNCSTKLEFDSPSN